MLTRIVAQEWKARQKQGQTAEQIVPECDPGFYLVGKRVSDFRVSSTSLERSTNLLNSLSFSGACPCLGFEDGSHVRRSQT